MIEAWRDWQNGVRSPDNYRRFMIRELLVWLVGVPMSIAIVIGYFVF